MSSYVLFGNYHIMPCVSIAAVVKFMFISVSHKPVLVFFQKEMLYLSYFISMKSLCDMFLPFLFATICFAFFLKNVMAIA